MTDTLFEVSDLGVITMDTPEIKTTIETLYKNAFGTEINLDSSTFAGQCVVNDTTLLTKAQEMALNLVNSFNIYYGVGYQLDVAGAWWGYYRKSGVATVVIGTITGSSGTVIPAGSLVEDTNSYQYSLLDDTTIPSGGTIDAEFQCTTGGAITCLAGTMTTIISTLTGWDTITNASDGIVGYAEESDNTFKQRMTANELNIKAVGLMASIIDNVAQLDNVISVKGNENPLGTSAVVDGITMLAHSIYLCVLGGASTDIAEVLLKKKTQGANTNGTTIISYYDENVDYTYYYKIYRPTVVALTIQINYSANASTPDDVEDKIKTQLIAYISANPFMIGETISGNLLAKAFENWAYINLLSIKIDNSGWVDYRTMTSQQVASLSSDDIEINEI